MNKQKRNFHSLDVTAMVSSLQKVVGLRLANIFDVNPKTYIFKFAKNERKEQLIIENGLRFHLTTAANEKNSVPSAFNMKFRKFIRSKCLMSVKQVGIERVVDFTFGTENCYHLILEMYDKGNIVLADKDYVVIQLLRSHEFTEHARTALHQVYPMAHSAKISMNSLDISHDNIKAILQSNQELIDQQQQQQQQQQEQQEEQQNKNKKQKPKKIQIAKPKGQKKLSEVIFQLLPCCHPKVVEHFIRENEQMPNHKVTMDDLDMVIKVAHYGYQFLEKFCKQTHFKGYLVRAPAELIEQKPGEEAKEAFLEFSPFLFWHMRDKDVLVVDDYSNAVDKYFGSIVIKKTEKEQIEDKAQRKYRNMKEDQEKRIAQLTAEVDRKGHMAQLIELNANEVEAIIRIVSALVGSGTAWDKIKAQVSESRKAGDPLANLIHNIDFSKNTVQVLLQSDPDDPFQALEVVDINYHLSAHGNVEEYYSDKKRMAAKQAKTEQFTGQALKLAEKNAKEEGTQNKHKTDVINQRKKMWFEKFYWFLSSENYLVLCGKDVQQNELLVKKYLLKDDIYLHADFHGAASTIIKNPSGRPVTSATLQEAAQMAVARSKAWENKQVGNAWWVYASQVSKSAPTGEYLPQGSFMIRGKKNYVQVYRLEMGVGLLFRLDTSSQANHKDERKPKVQQEEEQDQVQEEQEKDLGDIDNFQVLDYNFVKEKKQQPKSKKNQEKQELEKRLQEQKEEERKAKEKNKQRQTNQEQDEKKLPRGKQHKLNKMKKYEEQTEEERMIKMRLIGAKEVQMERQEKVQVVPLTDRQKKLMKKNKNKLRMNTTKDQRFTNTFKDVIQMQKEENKEKEEEEEEEKVEKEVEKMEEKMEQKEDEEEMMEQKEEEKMEEEKEEEKEEVKEEDEEKEEKEEKKEKEEDDELDPTTMNDELSLLTGCPTEDDLYYYAVPMCAPYVTLQNNYLYKVKLLQGALKKGKAGKEIQRYFLSQKDLPQLDKKFIRGITDIEMVNDLIGGVKVVAPGIQKLKEAEKKKKVEKKRQQ